MDHLPSTSPAMSSAVTEPGTHSTVITVKKGPVTFFVPTPSALTGSSPATALPDPRTEIEGLTKKLTVVYPMSQEGEWSVTFGLEGNQDSDLPGSNFATSRFAIGGDPPRLRFSTIGDSRPESTRLAAEQIRYDGDARSYLWMLCLYAHQESVGTADTADWEEQCGSIASRIRDEVKVDFGDDVAFELRAVDPSIEEEADPVTDVDVASHSGSRGLGSPAPTSADAKPSEPQTKPDLQNTQYGRMDETRAAEEDGDHRFERVVDRNESIP